MARGEFAGPTGADQELIAQSIGSAGDAARNALQTQGDILAAQGREQLSSRGVSGSSSEVLGTLLNQLGTQQGINQSIYQQQAQGGQALLNLPFQRAQTQIGANQALFQQILGASNPALSSLTQSRIAQPTTTQTQSGVGLNQIAQLGAIAAAPFTGGASLAALPALSVSGNQLYTQKPDIPGIAGSGYSSIYTGPSLYGRG